MTLSGIAYLGHDFEDGFALSIVGEVLGVFNTHKAVFSLTARSRHLPHLVESLVVQH